MLFKSSLLSLTLYFAAYATAYVGPGYGALYCAIILLSLLIFNPNEREVTGNTAVHDPTMCKDDSGTYYVFCKSFGHIDPRLCGLSQYSVATSQTYHDVTVPISNRAATGVGLEIRTSPDRTAWTFTGLVWPNGASWTDEYTGTSNGYVYECLHLNGC